MNMTTKRPMQRIFYMAQRRVGATGRPVVLFTALMLMSHAANVSAQVYPSKPVRVVVGFAGGGSTDIIARLMAQRFTENLGQPFVVENRTGATGAIADEHVARSAPDGYTLLVNAGSAAVIPALRKLPYELLRDLAPVSLLATVPFIVVVHPSLPARTITELITLARKQPGKLSYGSSGIAGTHHLAGELFNQMAKVDIVHVPFKGAAENVVATAAGQIEMSYATPPAALPLLRTGRLRALAITAMKRSSLLPELPTLHEAGLAGYDRPNWNGLLTTAATPRDIIARLNAAAKSALNSQAIQDGFAAQGLEVAPSSSEEFVAFIKKQLSENAKLVRLAGIKAD